MEWSYRFFRWSENKWWIIGFLAGIATVVGFITYWCIYDLGFWQSLMYTAQLFTIDVKTPFELKELLVDRSGVCSIIDLDGNINQAIQQSKYWYTIYVAGIFATLTVGLGLFLLFFRGVLSRLYRNKVISNGNHTIVIGLGRNSRFFINSMLEEQEKKENEEECKHSILVFEIDKENPFLETYEKKRLALVVDEIDNMIDTLNLENCKNIFISTGSDERNIYYASQFLDRLKGNENVKLLVHIEDRTLRNLYSDKKILDCKKTDMRVFSFYKESARIVFQRHTIDEGVIFKDDKAESNNKNFSIYIVGDSELSIALVVEAYKVAHFPDEKNLTITLIAKNINALKHKIEYAFPEIDEIKEVTLEYKRLDSRKNKFYIDDIWKNITGLKHVFYCDNDVTENIRIATKVSNRVFLRRENEQKKIKFHIATMNQIKIASKLETSEITNLFVFAQAKKVCSYENLLDNELDKIAKLINYEYYLDNLKKDDKKEDIDIHWSKTPINDKKSSLGQAIHMQSKLKYLGLTMVDDDSIVTLKENKKVLYKALEIKNISDFICSKKMQKKLDKLAIAEHNRWMALLRLMDYQYTEGKKDKDKKLHPLLKPWNKFSEQEKKDYEKFDVKAVFKMAEYATKLNKSIRVRNINIIN